MRIAICDDDKQQADNIADAIKGLGSSGEIEIYQTGEELLKASKREPYFTVVFLDIYFPIENGIEIAKELQKISPDTEIVFVTTSREHAVEAFSVRAIHYLVKPVTSENIQEVFGRLARNREKAEITLAVNVGRSLRRIPINDIYSLQSSNHATEIIMSDGAVIKTWATLEDLKTQLDDNFLKIQRGMIVNMHYIEQMGADSCVLRNGTKLLLSRKDKAYIRDKYNNFVFRNISG